ncbi:MAG: creatininase family protein, partial [Ignisphaera sp.]
MGCCMGCGVKVWLVPGSRFDRLEKGVAIIPVGSVERHGDHLPLGTDALEAMYVAEKVADELCAHLFPPVWYGAAKSLARFSGTIDVGDGPLYAYMCGILRGVASMGYRIIVVVNGHGGNTLALRLAAKKVSFETGTSILVVNWWSDLAQEKRRELFTYPGHAGEDETSAVLHIAPETVDMSSARDHITEPIPSITVYSPKLEEKLYPRAVLGKPTLASAEKGRIWLEEAAKDLATKVREVAKL